MQTFELYPLRFHMVAGSPLHFRAGEAANLLRGRLGKFLHDSPEIYRRLFAPQADSGPSGLHDAPRPFVLRVRHLDGVRIAAGGAFHIGLNLFDTKDPPIDVLRDALSEATAAGYANIKGTELMRLSLDPPPQPIDRLRVHFLTATELKPADHPEFCVLFARIRDRISTLRALYGSGSLEIDFRAMADRARAIRMTHCELQRVENQRLSRATGQRHSLGGFIGVAEYQGDLAEFAPYLEAARWTGVGRQTVWGKGELAWETL